MSRKQIPEFNAQVVEANAFDRIFAACVSGKGGVGKSFFIQLLAVGLREAGRDPVVVSLDRIHGAAPLKEDFQFFEQTMPKQEEVTEDPCAIQRRFSALRPITIDNPDKDLICDFGSEASTYTNGLSF